MLTTEGRELECYIKGNPRRKIRTRFFEDTRLDVKYSAMDYTREYGSPGNMWNNIFTEDDVIDVAYKMYKEARRKAK